MPWRDAGTAAGKGNWHCGAHTLISSQEAAFVTGFAAARQIGADYLFDDTEAAGR